MARMDWTRIFVAAPGLRPTASEAFMPMRPTPKAAPSAAKPTCMFPVNSANIGINDIYISFLSVARRLPRLNTDKSAKFSRSVMSRLWAFLVLANQHGEDGGEQHEDQGLYETNQQFHEVKGDWQQPTEMGHQLGHGFEHIFAR